MRKRIALESFVLFKGLLARVNAGIASAASRQT